MTFPKTLSAALLALGISFGSGLSMKAEAQGNDLGKASDVVRLLFAKHGARLESGGEPLLNDPGMIRRFFDDCMAVDGLQGKLGFDPIYDAQDFEISDLQIYPDPDVPILRGAAQIHLDFKNFGTPISHIYTLIKAANGEWQISDIYSETNGWSLNDVMRKEGIAYAACDANTEVTLFDPPGAPQKPAEEEDGFKTGMEEGDLPAHMDSMDDMQTGGDPDENVGMEQGDLPGDGKVAGKSDLLFILDASGSMWGQIDGVAKISTAKQALKGLIGDLGNKTDIGLMAYGHRREGDCGDIEVVLPVASHAPGQVGPGIDGITPRGKTPIASALKAAAGAFGNPERPANVLLISDGLETCGGDPCAAAEALAAQGIGTRVHVVGFDLKDEEKKALQCIADRGNGNYYTADNAEEFGEALKKVADAVDEEPAPAPAPASLTFFEESFDGPALDPAWSITNENPNLEALDGKGSLFVAAAGKNANYDSEEAANRLILDKALPDGDFDLVLNTRVATQTGQEHVWLSVYGGPADQLGALMWIDWKGCGPALRLSLVKLSGESGGKIEKTAFEQNLFDGPMVDNICSKAPRAYANAILKALFEEGATVKLQRRGRTVTAALEMNLPAFEEHEAKPYSFQSEPITALRLSGKPSVFAGQWQRAAPGESHYFLDRFAIEEVRQ